MIGLISIYTTHSIYTLSNRNFTLPPSKRPCAHGAMKAMAYLGHSSMLSWHVTRYLYKKITCDTYRRNTLASEFWLSFVSSGRL